MFLTNCDQFPPSSFQFILLPENFFLGADNLKQMRGELGLVYTGCAGFRQKKKLGYGVDPPEMGIRFLPTYITNLPILSIELIMS
jgi:hypothetical protein